jgi:hypothetical protein
MSIKTIIVEVAGGSSIPTCSAPPAPILLTPVFEHMACWVHLWRPSTRACGDTTFAVRWTWGIPMAKATITIPLDPETARAYGSAGPEEKRKMQALVSLWLRELAAGEYPPLQQVLDEVGRKARARGLTPEMLDSLLKGA